MLHKSIVFLGSTLGQRLEPVRIVCDAHLQGPLLHAVSHSVSDASVQAGAVVHHVNHLVVDVLGQVTEHLLLVEDVFAKIFRGTLRGHLHLKSTLLESLLYYLKS